MTCMTIRTQVAREMALPKIKQRSQLQQPTASHYFKMSTSYDNNSNYSIYVMAYERGFPERKELEIPCVSICWNVIRSYKSDNLSFKPSIEDYNSEHTDHDVFASISSPNYKSPQSRETISGLISRINFPFQLDRLSWRGLSNNSVKPLEDVEDMISHILELISGMVDKGRRKVDLNVQVKMQYTLPHEEYEAKVRARKARDLTEDLIRLTAMLQSQLAGMENPHGAIAGMTLRYYHECRKRIEDEMRANNISPEMTMSDPRLLEMEAAIRESFDQAVVKSRPASKASVEALERFVMDDEGGGSSSRSSVLCVICQHDMVTGSEVIRLPCSQSHTFHGYCIIQYLKGYGHTCPLCKFKLPEELNDLP